MSRVEQLGAAGPATVDALGLGVDVLAGATPARCRPGAAPGTRPGSAVPATRPRWSAVRRWAAHSSCHQRYAGVRRIVCYQTRTDVVRQAWLGRGDWSASGPRRPRRSAAGAYLRRSGRPGRLPVPAALAVWAARRLDAPVHGSGACRVPVLLAGVDRRRPAGGASFGRARGRRHRRPGASTAVPPAPTALHRLAADRRPAPRASAAGGPGSWSTSTPARSVLAAGAVRRAVAGRRPGVRAQAVHAAQPVGDPPHASRRPSRAEPDAATGATSDG